jgi:hypothetical protein
MMYFVLNNYVCVFQKAICDGCILTVEGGARGCLVGCWDETLPDDWQQQDIGGGVLCPP